MRKRYHKRRRYQIFPQRISPVYIIKFGKYGRYIPHIEKSYAKLDEPINGNRANYRYYSVKGDGGDWAYDDLILTKSQSILALAHYRLHNIHARFIDYEKNSLKIGDHSA
jgi:hypothetical protein